MARRLKSSLSLRARRACAVGGLVVSPARRGLCCCLCSAGTELGARARGGEGEDGWESLSSLRTRPLLSPAPPPPPPLLLGYGDHFSFSCTHTVTK